MPQTHSADTVSVLGVTEENRIYPCTCAVQLGRTGRCQGPGAGCSGELWERIAGALAQAGLGWCCLQAKGM